VAKQSADRRTNNDLRFWFFVTDDTGALLYSDRANLKGSNLVTKRNKNWSVTYGVANGYLSVSGNRNLRVYVMSYNNEANPGPSKTWIDFLYMSPADQESDLIYQDLSLALRHHKPNDKIQLAGSEAGVFFDVPLRIAGKNIMFDVTGGWDTNSHDGVKYTVRDWELYKSHLNYVRFAYFRRQRDWAFNAISMNMYVYFPSVLKGIHITNEWPDLPNAHAYDAMNLQLVMHAPVEVAELKVNGLYRAGDIFAYGDAAQQIDNKLTIRDLQLGDCMQGLRVRPEHIDCDILSNECQQIPGGSFIVSARRSASVPRKLRISGNTLTDCGVLEALATDPMLRNDEFSRSMPSFTDSPGQVLQLSWYTPNPYFIAAWDPRNAPIAIVSDGNNVGAEPNMEIDNNIFLAPGGRESRYNIVFAGQGSLPDAQVKIHDNISTVGKDFIGLQRTGERSQFFNPTEPDWHNWGIMNALTVTPWDTFVDSADAVAWLDANNLNFFAVYDNTLSDMRSIAHFPQGTALHETSPIQAPNMLVEDNACTNVSFALHFSAASSMTPQMWHQMNKPEGPWFRVQNNGSASQKHITWNILPTNPEVSPLLHQYMCKYGVLPQQILTSFRA
jgi:hypothetical protein